ncbi:mechanosensitive ion channel family protein [Novipirellula caenicola]|uniref:Mechanosensitive ion channel MscS domain-containing protein n=1 Tax=Novipirellula caenicola TaxID=1536901 RepID=A0ABP9VP98_9BACT
MPDAKSSQEEVTRILREWSEIHLLEAIFVLAAGFTLAAIIKWIVPRLAERVPDRFRLWILPWEPILRAVMLLFVAAYIIPLFIYPTPQNLLAISGALAVALGFAFKDYVSSLIAGVVALYERPYRNGDWVKIEETYGEVRSLDLRTVQIVTPDDTVVAVPHSKIWSTPIYNNNVGKRELMCVADFYLHPDHDGQRVQQKLTDIALTSPYVQLHKPILVVAAEKPWGTHYRLKAYPIDGRDQFQFITDLTLRGKAMLRRIGVQSANAPTVTQANS